MLAFQQSPVPPSPATPPTPATPPAPGAYVVSSGALPAVMSKQDVAMLQARRSELSRQLESAAGWRRQLSEQIRRADGADKAGLEARLAVLDTRMARLESDIDEVGVRLASPAAARVGSTAMPQDFGFRSSNVRPEAIVVPFTLFVLCPIAVSISRLIWKRGSRQHAPALTTDSAQRLERMEQAMDAIAIEVERVSEGQRFVTRLLSERGGALPVGQPAE